MAGPGKLTDTYDFRQIELYFFVRAYDSEKHHFETLGFVASFRFTRAINFVENFADSQFYSSFFNFAVERPTTRFASPNAY